MDVFISHVEEDAAAASQLVEGLEAAGYTTWYYERDSIPGLSYLLQTGRAIDECKVVVLLISKNSLSSHQVTKEVVRAHENGKPFMPLLLDISHVEFQSRQPEWREAIGAATSIRTSPGDVVQILSRVIAGLEALIGGEPTNHRAPDRVSTPCPAETAPPPPRILIACGIDSSDARLRLTLENSYSERLRSDPSSVAAALPIGDIQQAFASIASVLSGSGNRQIKFGRPAPWFFEGTPYQRAACGFNIPALGLSVGDPKQRGYAKYELSLLRDLACLHVWAKVPSGWVLEGARVDQIDAQTILEELTPVAKLLHAPCNEINWDEPEVNERSLIAGISRPSLGTWRVLADPFERSSIEAVPVNRCDR